MTASVISRMAADWRELVAGAVASPPSNVLAAALFGSCARGDDTADSDIDLLLVTTEKSRRHATNDKLSIYMYPRRDLELSAQIGDLFVCHIVREALVLSDSFGYIDKLKHMFHLRRSYAKEIDMASDLGWFLARYGGLLHEAVAARRIAWCVRTLLIARAAESGRPVFSAKELSSIADFPGTYELISQKEGGLLKAGSLDVLSEFLRRYGAADALGERASALDYVSRFRGSHNQVALQTLGRGRFELLY